MNRSISRLLALTLVAVAPGCGGCQHRAGQLVSKDSHPSASPNPVDFGDVPVGERKVLPVTLTNTGSLDLAISAVSLTQGQSGPAEFSFTETTNVHAPFGSSLQAGAKATIYIEFQPAQTGEQTGTLTIQSNSNALPSYTVPLRGNGSNIVIGVKPTTLDFGNVQVGTFATLAVTFSNTGTDASSPIQVQPIVGTQASAFGWTGTPGPIQANGSFTLQITFTPGQQGPASALLPYLDCATCNPQQISLSGVGVDGQIVFSPSPVSFLNVPVGTNSTQQVTLTNQGLAAVALTSLTTQNPQSPFSVSESFALPQTILPGASVTATVSYTASQTGNDQDSLTAVTQPLLAGGQEAQVPAELATDQLFGNGKPNPCTLAIQPPSINFGNPGVGTAVTKSVTLTNSGAQDCAVSGIGLSPGTDPAFTLDPAQAASLTIHPAQSTTIAVTCDLTSSGTPLLHTGRIVFQSNDPVRANGAVPLSAYVKGSGPYADGWPKWHADNTDQGRSQADTSANQGTELWTVQLAVPQSAGGMEGMVNPNPSYLNSPIVGPDGTVYQLGMDGTFVAVDPGGNILWKDSLLAPNPDEHPATPILAADGTIYLESGTDSASMQPAQLYHIDSATGKILFQIGPPTGCAAGGSNAANGNSSGGCQGADGFDVNPSIGQDGLLFDGDDFGQTVTYQTGSNGSLTQSNTLILPWGMERVAVAIDQNDQSYWCCGALCFGVTAPESGFQAIPAWPAAGVTVGSGGGFLQNSDLAYDEQHTGWLMIEVGTQTGNSGQTTLAAIDPANGQQHWVFNGMPSGTTPGNFSPFTGSGLFNADVGNSAPAIAADGTVYVGNVDGLYAVDGATGSLKSGFPFKTSSDLDTAVAIGGDGTIFFGTADGTFYAVNPDGSQRFKLATHGRISSSPAIGPDGTVFFVSDDGLLHAVR